MQRMHRIISNIYREEKAELKKKLKSSGKDSTHCSKLSSQTVDNKSF